MSDNSKVERAASHLADAETAVMSWIVRLDDADEDAVDADFLPMLLAVMRSVSHAAGILESMVENVSPPRYRRIEDK